MKKLSGILTALFMTVAVAAISAGDDLNAVYDGKSDVKAWQSDARIKLANILGYDQLIAEPQCDLNPQTLWKRKVKNGTIEKVKIQIDPKFATTLYICIPDNSVAPHKVFICLPGHPNGIHATIGMDRKEAKPIKVSGDRDFAVYCMKRGIPVICFEQRAMREENVGKKKQTTFCRQASSQAVLDGRSLNGYRVFDIKRLIDYIKSRPDFFDSSRIGIIGHSQGGTAATYAGALLPELTHVMVSGCFSAFKDGICKKSTCFCNYVPFLLQYGEAADVAGLIAPRPLVIVNGSKDYSFPIAGARREFKRVKQIYSNLGAADNCRHVIGPKGHQFYADQAWKAMLPLWNK